MYFTVAVIIGFVIPLPNGLPEYPQITIQDSAYLACMAKTKEWVKIPHIDSNLYSKYSVIKLVERNHYGVIVYTMEGTSYQCDLARLIGGKWFLKSLYVKTANPYGLPLFLEFTK